MSPLAPSPPSSDSNTNWRDLYRAALRELDQTKLAQRVAEAEAVVAASANQSIRFTSHDEEEDLILKKSSKQVRVSHFHEPLLRQRSSRHRSQPDATC